MDIKINKINEICAIIVTYNPSVERIIEIAERIQKNGCDVLIVDNSDTKLVFPVDCFFAYIWLQGNKGIATAQNVGIKFCLKEEYKYIIFFDQDSVISDGFINTLLLPIKENSYLVGAPVFFDEKKGFEYAITHINSNGTRKKLFSANRTAPFTSSVAISSGTLVRSDVFNKIGLMDESLFIDYVDTEWCLRCFANNILVNIIPQAKMVHSIGDNSFNFLGFCVPVHSPVRRYYRVRNSFHLLRYPHVPKLLAMREIIFSFIHTLLIITTQKNKRDYALSFFDGVKDGILNVRGKKK